MAFVRKLAEMASRQVRKLTTGNTQGLRQLASRGSLASNNNQSSGNWWEKTKGFLWDALKVARWTVKGALDIFFSVIEYVKNFNWNMTVREVNQDAQQAWVQLAGRLGGFVGGALGWLACGALPGLVISTFSPALGAYILEEVGEEAFSELVSTFSSLITDQVRVWGDIVFRYFYIFVRNSFEVFLGKDIRRERKPWTLAQKYDEFIENIDDAAMQNFVEEMVEEFGDACMEAGYVVAGGVDDYASVLAANQASQPQNQRTISVSF